MVKLSERMGPAPRNHALCVSCIIIVGGEDAVVVPIRGQRGRVRSVPTDSAPQILLAKPLPLLLSQAAL